MEFEEYKKHLARRIETEVVPIIFRPPAAPPADPSKLPPPHPLPLHLYEDARRAEKYGSRGEAKRIVLEALRYIRENKRGVEEDLKKRLGKPPIYIHIPPDAIPPDLEERFMGVLKEWARKKAEELQRLQSTSESVGRRQQENAEGANQRLKYLPDFGPLALILPPIILDLIKKHGLLGDPEIRRELQMLSRELQEPPEFMRGEWYVAQLPAQYLRALHRSRGLKEGS